MENKRSQIEKTKLQDKIKVSLRSRMVKRRERDGGGKVPVYYIREINTDGSDGALILRTSEPRFLEEWIEDNQEMSDILDYVALSDIF